MSDLDDLPRVYCEGCGTEGHLRDSECETCAHLAWAQQQADELFSADVEEAA
jgi:hypothetical protein